MSLQEDFDTSDSILPTRENQPILFNLPTPHLHVSFETKNGKTNRFLDLSHPVPTLSRILLVRKSVCGCRRKHFACFSLAFYNQKITEIFQNRFSTEFLLDSRFIPETDQLGTRNSIVLPFTPPFILQKLQNLFLSNQRAGRARGRAGFT